MIQESFIQRPRKGASAKLSRADAGQLLDAIAKIYFAWSKGGEKTGAEKWSRCSYRRREIMEEVFRLWCASSGEDSVFPWSEDYVIDLWVAFRKQSDEIKREWFDYLGILS